MLTASDPRCAMAENTELGVSLEGVTEEKTFENNYFVYSKHFDLSGDDGFIADQCSRTK